MSEGGIEAGPLYVDVIADTTGFGRDLQAKINAETARVKANINAEIDARKAEAQLSAMERKQRQVTLGVSVDDAKAKAQLEAVEAKRRVATIRADADTAVADAKLAAAADKRRVASIKADADVAIAEAKLERATRNRKVEVKVDVDTKKLDEIGSKLQGFGTGALGLLPFPAIAAGISLAAGALAQVAAGLFAVVAAAAPAVGILAAIPGLVAGAAQGIGALIVGFSGIGNALKADAANQKASAATSSAASAQRAAAAQRIVAATDRVRQTQESLANTEANAARQIQQAQQSVADAHASAAREVAAAEATLAQSQRDAQQAQVDLTRARADATRQLQDMNAQVAGGRLGVEQAGLDVQRAQITRTTTLASPTATALDKQQADLSYREAVQRLKDQQREQQRLEADTKKANAAGVEGSDQVVTAKQRLLDATNKVHAAEVAVAQAQIDGAQKVARAEDALAAARRSAAFQVASAQHQVLLAQRDLADAQANATLQTSKQSAANTALAAAMDRLSPAGQKFVSFLTNVLQPAWLRVQKATQEALLPPVQRGLAALLPLLGVLQTGLVGTANVLGRAFEQLATAYLATPVFRRDLASIMTANTRAFATLGTALVPLTRATIDLIVASEPLLQRFADFIAYSATLLGNWIALQRSTGALGRFFQVAGDTAAQLWRIIRDLGVAIYNIGKAAFPAGQLLLSSFEGVVAKFRDWTASMQGQNTLRDYFDKAVPTVQALGRLLDGVVRAFFRLGKNTDFAGLLDMIRTQALPAIERLAATLNGAFGPALVKAVTDVINLFADLAGAGGGGALTAFVETLDRVVLAFDAIARNPVGGVILRIAASAAGMAAAFSLLGGPLIRIGVLLARVGGFAVGFFQVARGAEAATSGITKIGGVIATKLIPWVTRLGVLFLASGPWGWIILGIAAVVTGLILAYQHFEGFRNLVNNVLRTVGAAALWFYRNAILPAFNGVKVAIAAVGAAALWLWHNAIVPAFNAIGTLVTWWWRNVVQPPLAALVNFFRQVIAPVVSWLWASIFRPIFGFIGTLISVWWRGVQLEFKAFVWFLQRVIGPVITWLWRNVVVPVFAGIGGTIKATVAFVTGIINTLNAFLRNVVGPTFSWLWRTIIVPAWNGIGSIVRGVWVNFISPAFEAIKTGLTKVKDAFGTAVKLISALWNGLKNVVAVPVRFVLDTIYNNGIRGIWNKVAGLVHLPTLPEVKIKGINAARGAVVPGYAPGVDIVNAVLSPGEGILVPEAVRGIARMMGTTAEQAIQWLNSMFSPRVSRPPASRQRRRGAPGQAGMLPPHFGIGGVFSWVGEQIGKGASAATSFVGSSISSVLGALKDLVAGALSGPLHAAAAPLHALINKVLPATPAFVNLLRAMANQGLDKAIDFVVGQDKKVTPSSAGLAVPVGSVGAGVERWRGLVSQALAIIGQPQALANTVLYRMNIESGGNPNAINLTDSNAQHGDPSRGLMQTIMSTFMAYHYPGTSFNIYDPMANVLASMRYALARYGSLAAAYLRKGGYALGGVLPGLSQALGAGAPKAFDVGGLLQPGWTVAQNTSGQPEMVFTAPQWDTLSRIVASAAGNTARPDGVAGSSSQTNITIPVQAARGMDTRQLAREVAVELAWQMRG